MPTGPVNTYKLYNALKRAANLRISSDELGININWGQASPLRVEVIEEPPRCKSCGSADLQEKNTYCSECIWNASYQQREYIGMGEYENITRYHNVPIPHLSYEQALDCFVKTGKTTAYNRMLEAVTLTHPKMVEPADRVNEAINNYNKAVSLRNEYLRKSRISFRAAALVFVLVTCLNVVIDATANTAVNGSIFLLMYLSTIYPLWLGRIQMKRRKGLENESIRLRAAIPNSDG